MSKVVNSKIRKTIIQMLNKGNASHLGSAFSMVEILNSIFMSVDVNKIKNQKNDRDRVILSKGHGASGLYAVMFHHGLLSEDAINSYFKDGSIMAGHASHFIKTVEHSTGALGHGLSVGLGIAIGSLSKNYKNRIFVVVGDGELHEGSNWEAIMYAGHKKVGNLCLMIDKNERSQMGETSLACSLDPLLDKLEAFNFNAIELKDGHNEIELIEAIKKTRNSVKPVAIICNTTKGKGVSFMEGDNVWHYRPPSGIDYENALIELNVDD
ncbi:transketolase [Candidatus Pseudothioglobus singularis]|nr:transketolase [Candidatus Pseudothioglobus singularis]